MYGVLYSFKGGTDGAEPEAGLLDVKATLYGTTYGGGGNACRFHFGCGTVFAITTSGGETVLHSFKSGKHGEYPRASLINVNGTLYGTVFGSGGPKKGGKVFKITASGKETVVHSFGLRSGDGAEPLAGLVDNNGTLYGTTAFGGSGSCDIDGGSECGTVYAITPAGGETVLYSFKGAPGDGAFPAAGLVDVNGVLYGTTFYGGNTGCVNEWGCGTVFEITTAGTESALYSFGSRRTDGENPSAGLININGTLYGTTSDGGAYGDGTVFKITTAGAETVLHSFAGSPGDGKQPEAGLLDVKGTLYGTTYEGGSGYTCGLPAYGCGTVYAITRSGKETVLHNFGAGSGDDDGNPDAGLINVKGMLYGTTSSGGADGKGTVFSLAP
jgi:uncharacterized repeat protein (TIGR03803 family)